MFLKTCCTRKLGNKNTDVDACFYLRVDLISENRAINYHSSYHTSTDTLLG